MDERRRRRGRPQRDRIRNSNSDRAIGSGGVEPLLLPSSFFLLFSCLSVSADDTRNAHLLLPDHSLTSLTPLQRAPHLGSVSFDESQRSRSWGAPPVNPTCYASDQLC